MLGLTSTAPDVRIPQHLDQAALKRAVRVAALIYLILRCFGHLLAIQHLDQPALPRRGQRDRGRPHPATTLSQRNVVPELSSVAGDFDKLVHDLRRVSRQIRQSAEDSAHSFKTPLAAIQSSLSPVRRAVPAEDQRSRRALEIIDSALARLLALVNAAQRLDSSAADLVEAPRILVNLTEIVGEATLHFREIMASRDIRLIRRLDDAVLVRASRGVLEVALQNILENAIGFSPRGSSIVLTLTRNPPPSNCRSTTRTRHRTRQDRSCLRALFLFRTIDRKSVRRECRRPFGIGPGSFAATSSCSADG